MKKLCSLLIIVLFLSACGDDSNSNETSTSENQSDIDKLVMAYLPLEGGEGVQQTNAEFEDGLSEKIGVPVESYQVSSYNAAIEAMGNEEADMVIMPPFAYILGVERAGIEALVGAKEQDGVQSNIIVSSESEIEDITQLEGKTFGFVDPSSSSGHLLPKTMMLDEMDMSVEELENDFLKEEQFVGSHESALIGAVNGQYDATAIASPIPEALVDRGVIEEDSYRIIAESDTTPPPPFSVRGGLPEETKDQVKEYLLNFDEPNFLQNLLGMEGAEFVEVDDSDYDFYRTMSESLNMSPEELMNQ
ncbi:phosphate/phosphite/phosphonate ABC transporter substrate-binding protein [Salibacterium salarium]|uniref:phosphate/phosphite/phosphonate ABC transporter substrate-binding protein n=1 Tax=Salibacterium salarium TaxID=284579 RepID=UPI00163B20B6|nr:phosphate/phosphite/phosphonate ABC transporter substrate-binding protein [Salibacterium salarium]